MSAEVPKRALTGVRPTGDLSIANYVGAMKPIIDMQTSYDGEINVFVADIHGLTDQEPGLINNTRLDTVRSFIAAGVDAGRTNVYLQSQIEEPTIVLASFLDRHMSVAELLRVPTLKDKIKKGEREESVTVALARYPILMAADIFIQDATDVPVGRDQYPHLEVAKLLARRFNKSYGDGEDVIVVPEILASEGLRIVALNGKGKMSKSDPSGAIFLKDSPEEVQEKVKRAQTSNVGEISEALESHFILCEQLTADPEIHAQLESLKTRHLAGEQVMAGFKSIMTEVISDFLSDFQHRYQSVSTDDVADIIKDGSEKAQAQAEATLDRVKKAMNFV